MPTEEEVQSEERDRDDKSVRKRIEAFVPDLVKRTFYAGLGAVFTTEEGMRKLATEFSLPKDVVNYLINSSKATKDELYRIVAGELRGFLQGLNISQELAKLLTTLSFEVKMEARFIPNDEAVAGVKPEVRKKVTIKRTKGETPSSSPTSSSTSPSNTGDDEGD